MKSDKVDLSNLVGLEGRSSKHFLREYFYDKGILKPSKADLKKIPEQDLYSSWISVQTIHDLEQYRRFNC